MEILYEFLSYYEYLPDGSEESPNECKGVFDLPPITFVIDGIRYPLYAEDYIISIRNDGEVDFYRH